MTEQRTIRQMIAEVLEGGMMTAGDISSAVGIMEKEVYEHLPHVARSLSHSGEGGHGPRRLRFVVEPPLCRGCGFSFRKRDRLKTPGRCPLCRSEQIRETRFGITDK